MIFMKMKVLKLWFFAFLLILSLGCLWRICVVANQALELANNPNFAFWGAFFDTSDVIYFLGLIPICALSIKTICSYIKEANSFYASEREIRNSNKTTVDGILDSKTKSEMDKDGDGKIMISEYYPLSEEEVLEKIITVDANFSKENFYAWVKHLYSTLLESFDKKNPMLLRRFESDYLYQRHVALFKDKEQRGEVINNYYIKGVLLKDFKIEGDKEVIEVALTASLNRNKFDNLKENRKTYILTFSREKGLKTEGDLLDDKEMNCPNCGAVLDLDSNGICAYCHTVIPSGKYGWILIDMKSIQLLGE